MISCYEGERKKEKSAEREVNNKRPNWTLFASSVCTSMKKNRYISDLCIFVDAIVMYNDYEIL